MAKPSVVPSARTRSVAVGASLVCTRSPGRAGAAWIHLAGELDLSGVPVVTGRLREAQASSYLVVVDLRELEFIDCAGLGLLAAAEGYARRMERCLVLIRPAGQVDRMLELTCLSAELEVVDIGAPSPVDEM